MNDFKKLLHDLELHNHGLVSKIPFAARARLADLTVP